MRSLIAFALIVLASPASAQQNGTNPDFRYQSNPLYVNNKARMIQEQIDWVRRIKPGCGSNADCRYQNWMGYGDRSVR